MDKTDIAARVTALLVTKQNIDAGRVETLNMGVGSNAEHRWLLDAVALLLEVARNEPGPAP